jgi:hypothetical protein
MDQDATSLSLNAVVLKNIPVMSVIEFGIEVGTLVNKAPAFKNK